ncbi:MAG TPA: ABC transporter permease [Pyrinomonadaceae bacterium]|jgi:putative ABC transport system permease protein
MSWSRVAAARLRGLLRRDAVEQDIDDELRLHVEMASEENVRRGMTPADARRAALACFGDVTRVKEAARDVRGGGSMETMIQDVRFGLRMLTKNPGFTAVAVIALALGIGANSAIFSVVNAVLLRPLPYKDPERIVMVWEDDSRHGYPRDTPAPANYVDWRDQNKVFEDMAAIAELSFNLTGAGEPERLDGRRVSASFFPILGVEPQLGRRFTPEEDRPGENHVVILSHGLWQRRFGSDAGIIGKTITLNGYSFAVVGVMPQSFQFPTREDQFWIPIAFTQQEAARRGSHFLEVIARLKPGVTLEQARAEMSTIAGRLQQQYPAENTELGAAVVPLHEQLVGNIRTALLVLLGAVGFVLLVACANVANLLLARAAGRQKEIATRVALGASRLRLVRQFLTESVLLAAVGGVVGLLLSAWGVRLLKAFIPENISQAGEITVDLKVLLFTLLISLLTGLVFGLAPATQATKLNLNETLKEGGRDSAAGSRGNRIRGVLVVSEVALSLILLIGAGLLINSFLRLRNVDPGFHTDNLLTMSVSLPAQKYPDHARRSAFYTEMIRRVEALPGVRSAAITSQIPLVKQGDTGSITVEGRPDPPRGQANMVAMRIVSPHYFQTMSIRLLRGREFGDQDRADAPAVAVISEGMARRYWPGEDPTGKRICPGKPESPDDWVTVVGVVNDVQQFGLDAESKPQMYLTYQQSGYFSPRHLVVGTNVEPTSLASAVRGAVWGIDPDQPVSNISTMEEVLSESIARQRFSTLLLGVFGVVALVLAAVGIYGVMSYSVSQRTHEIGIRMALGAQTGDVLKLAVGQGLKLVMIGVGVGLAASVVLTRVMSSLLFGISSTDPATFAVISLVLVGAGVLASYIPARRATKVDPMIALRYE